MDGLYFWSKIKLFISFNPFVFPSIINYCVIITNIKGKTLAATQPLAGYAPKKACVLVWPLVGNKLCTREEEEAYTNDKHRIWS